MISLKKPFKHLTESTDFVFTVQPTLYFCITIRTPVSTMPNAECLFGIWAVVDHTRLLLLPPSRTSRIKQKEVLQLQAKTNIPLHFDGLISLQPSLSKRSTVLWFNVDAHLAVKIFFSISNIGRFICCNFPMKHKVVLRYSRLITILSHKRTSQDTRIANVISHSPVQTADQNVYYDAAYDVARLSQQTAL